jgi:uncharacterized membrane protein required for colicin V production
VIKTAVVKLVVEPIRSMGAGFVVLLFSALVVGVMICSMVPDAIGKLLAFCALLPVILFMGGTIDLLLGYGILFVLLLLALVIAPKKKDTKKKDTSSRK